jgi:hypothetical protein
MPHFGTNVNCSILVYTCYAWRPQSHLREHYLVTHVRTRDTGLTPSLQTLHALHIIL